MRGRDKKKTPPKKKHKTRKWAKEKIGMVSKSP
jgi:hypothetical protein